MTTKDDELYGHIADMMKRSVVGRDIPRDVLVRQLKLRIPPELAIKIEAALEAAFKLSPDPDAAVALLRPAGSRHRTTKTKGTEMTDEHAGAIRAIAHAITPPGVIPGKDAAEGTVGSLTEATMGITAGLFRIAEAITDLAAAIRESRE